MSRCTIWVAPGKGSALGMIRSQLEYHAAGSLDDQRPTSLLIAADHLPDAEDFARVREIERRAAAGLEL